MRAASNAPVTEFRAAVIVGDTNLVAYAVLPGDRTAAYLVDIKLKHGGMGQVTRRAEAVSSPLPLALGALVLLDVLLPHDLDGYTVCRTLKTNQKYCHIIWKLPNSKRKIGNLKNILKS